MVEVRASEKLVYFNEAIWPYIPEGCNLQSYTWLPTIRNCQLDNGLIRSKDVVVIINF
jgi:hypothetical protein